MPKTKQQEAQEKRLQRNIRQAKKTRADAKTSGNKTVRTRPPKKGGFFAGLKTDAPQTVQQSIPYKEMYRDGICRLNDKLYTKTVQFFDINYQLAQADDKAQIFEGYCDFLNYFDASIHVQLTFINQRANMQDFARSIDIPIRGDEYDGIRREYGDMLKGQLQKGNNGLTKRKYITFGIEADDLRTAKMRLERIEADVLANFKALGAQAKPLDGLERLELLHSQLHPDGQEKFHFTWADLPKTGLSTKDFIAPSGLSFSNDGKTFRVGDHSGAVSFLQILAPELTDRLLAELLDLDDAVTVNLHIQSIDQAQAIKNIKRKMSDLQKMTIEEQKKAVRAGYDMDIIPTDLATYGEEAKNLLQDLQSRNERMFLVTVLVENIAPKRQKLFNDILSASGIAQKYNCIAAINGGEFADAGGQGTGAKPMGLTYSGGKNVWNDGLKRSFFGFDKNDRLVCREGMTKAEADKLGIRDAVSFQTGNVLIQQNGEDIKLFHADSDTGTAQRTAIGQRADGTVILLVTDGRSVDSIGATRNDVIDLMVSYGHIRTKYAPDWKEKFGGTDDMVKQTGIIGVTEGIYNDMIAYSKTSELMQDADFRQALGDSFIEIAGTDEGKDIIKVFSQVGYEWGDDANYDGERAAQEMLKSMN